MSDDVETLSDEQLRIRDLVYEGLRPVAGQVLTDHIMQQRAAAIARALVGHFVRGSVAKGEIVTMDRAAEERILADVRPPGHHPETGSILSVPNAVILSERAAGILQGFPESWVFSGDTKKARWSQIGQAMPPPLSHAVGTSVVEQRRAARAKGAA